LKSAPAKNIEHKRARSRYQQKLRFCRLRSRE
jgi:hypothetical protein